MTEDRKHQLDELDVTDILSYLNARVYGMEECIRRDGKHLTKAKELLRKILSEVRDEPQNYITSTTIAEAEQFLKGDE